MGRYLFPKALQDGGDHLDCFNGILPAMYANFGFEPVAKIRFNRDFAPIGWNYQRDGTSDIIFMAYNKNSEFARADPKTISEQIKKKITALEYSNTYDDAQNIQKKKIQEFNE